MIEYPWDYFFAIIGALGSAATAAALFFLWRQSKDTKKQLSLTQEEIQSTLRSWLGISHVYKNIDFQLEVHIKNHGRLVAKIVKVQLLLSPTKITEAQVRTGKGSVYSLMVFPDIETHIVLPDKISITTPYIGILINYQYATNKSGDYGLIAIQNQTKKELDYLETFAN